MRIIEAILRGILKAVAALPMAPLGLLSGLLQSVSQSESMPRPVRRAAAEVSDAAAAKAVRKYAAALTRDRELPDVSRVPKAYREYAKALTKKDAERVSRLSSEQVAQEIAKRKPAEASPKDVAPEPRPSAIQSDVRQLIRERKRERGHERRAEASGTTPAPRLDPRP